MRPSHQRCFYSLKLLFIVILFICFFTVNTPFARAASRTIPPPPPTATPSAKDCLSVEVYPSNVRPDPTQTYILFNLEVRVTNQCGYLVSRLDASQSKSVGRCPLLSTGAQSSPLGPPDRPAPFMALTPSTVTFKWTDASATCLIITGGTGPGGQPMPVASNQLPQSVAVNIVINGVIGSFSPTSPPVTGSQLFVKVYN